MPGKGGLWSMFPPSEVGQKIEKPVMKPVKNIKPEGPKTCLNTPILRQPVIHHSQSALPPIKSNNLMDTLATLALSAHSQPAPWDYAPYNAMYQMPSPFSLFNQSQEPLLPQIQLQPRQLQFEQERQLQFPSASPAQPMHQVQLPLKVKHPLHQVVQQSMHQQEIQKMQTYGILDPNVGEKTLLQATNYDDLDYPQSF